MFKKLLFSFMLFTQVSLLAAQSMGELLENKMWEYQRDENWSELEKKIAPCFQLALFDGVRDKEGFIKFVKALNIKHFTLSDFKVTEGPGVIIVTYNASTTENIEGKQVTARAVRMSVFQKNKNTWQWIAHAILIPVSETEAKKPSTQSAQ